MEKRRGNQAVGIILIIAGIYWACRALGLFQFSIFFDGWWTLFIIVPCLIGLLEHKSRGSNLVGMLFGVMLLLWRQGWISGSYIPAIFVAMIFILIGISIMMKEPKQSAYERQQYTQTESGNDKNAHGYYESASYDAGESFQQYDQTEQADSSSDWESGDPNQGDRDQSQRQQKYDYEKFANTQTSYDTQNRSTYETCPPSISAILVGKSVSCLNGVFNGTNVQTVLGNVQLDLRQAKLERDVYVNVNLILGGADIYLPENVRVVCEIQSILGDVRDIKKSLRDQDPGIPAIHIKGNCILGGLELK